MYYVCRVFRYYPIKNDNECDSLPCFLLINIIRNLILSASLHDNAFACDSRHNVGVNVLLDRAVDPVTAIESYAATPHVDPKIVARCLDICCESHRSPRDSHRMPRRHRLRAAC